jgi:hypothetical protein
VVAGGKAFEKRLKLSHSQTPIPEPTTYGTTKPPTELSLATVFGAFTEDGEKRYMPLRVA